MVKKQWQFLVVVPVLFLILAGSASAATYYVRTDGNDGNSGLADSASEAWATVQNAANRVVAGDTVLVGPGTYAENVVMTALGTAELPIAFRGTGEVVLASVNFPGSTGFSVGVSYYTVLDNLHFSGELGLSSFGIRLYGAGFVTVNNCRIDKYGTGIVFDNNAWRACYSITISDTVLADNSVAAGTTSSGMLENSLFEGCTFENNGYGYQTVSWGTRYTTFSRCTFRGNTIGVYLEGVYWYWLKTHSNKMVRSVFVDNGTGVLIGNHTAESGNGCSYNNSVINSVFAANRESGILVNTNFSGSNSPSAAYLDAQGQTFVNNIFFSNGSYGIDNRMAQTLFSSYNLAFGNGTAAGNNAPFDAANSSLTIDPLFVNAAAGDFRLRAGSPAIDAGSPAYDADPAVVGDHIDIGAFEYDTPAPVEVLQDLRDSLGDIPDSYLNNANNSIPLSKKLYVVMENILAADAATDPAVKHQLYTEALQKLTHDLLKKTDGCAMTGAPDMNDWILDCATQAEFYGPISEVIAQLQLL